MSAAAPSKKLRKAWRKQAIQRMADCGQIPAEAIARTPSFESSSQTEALTLEQLKADYAVKQGKKEFREAIVGIGIVCAITACAGLVIAALIYVGPSLASAGLGVAKIPFGWIAFLLAIYFLPTLIASGKKHAGLVFILNILFGWTVIVWFACVLVAVVSPSAPQSAE